MSRRSNQLDETVFTGGEHVPRTQIYGSSTAPHLRQARALDEGGRGLLLVSKLTQRWGTRQTPHGKTIWAEQALPRHESWP